jgi:hypothetical protein
MLRANRWNDARHMKTVVHKELTGVGQCSGAKYVDKDDSNSDLSLKLNNDGSPNKSDTLTWTWVSKRPRNNAAGDSFMAKLLSIWQLVVIALRRIVGQVLHELPVVAFRIVEVDTFPIKMLIGRGGIAISSCRHAMA